MPTKRPATKSRAPIARPEPGEQIAPFDIAQLQLDPKNARAHGDRDIKAIMASIRQWGWTNPIIVRAGTTQVVCGHGRVQAAIRLGLKTVPGISRVFATDADAKAYAIADNRTAELSAWDLPNLKDSLTELEGQGYDIALTGWTVDELQKMLDFDSEPEHDPDTLPVVGGPPVAKPGELWCLGDHRILCGDAQDPAVWFRLMGGRKAHAIFTDPPYGVAYEAQSGKYDAIKNDSLRHGALAEFLWRTFRNLVQHAEDTAAFYIWHASSTRQDFSHALINAGLTEQQYLIWVKPALVLGHDDYQWAHEPCFYAAKSGHKPAWHGDRSQPTTWRFSPVSPEGIMASVGRGLTLLHGPETLHLTTDSPKTKKTRTVRVPEDGRPVLIDIGNQPHHDCWEVSRDHNAEHPTQKPVALAVRALRNSTQYGELVLDAFLGSGTTLMGAEILGRTCYATEMEPKYVDLAVRRWELFTKKKAERA